MELFGLWLPYLAGLHLGWRYTVFHIRRVAADILTAYLRINAIRKALSHQLQCIFELILKLLVLSEAGKMLLSFIVTSLLPGSIA